MQRDLAEEAVSVLNSVHGSAFVAMNSAGLCKMVIFFCTKCLLNLKFSLVSFYFQYMYTPDFERRYKTLTLKGQIYVV